MDQSILHNLSKKFKSSENKIAAFDFDFTLVKTKNGKVFPENSDDWEILFPNILNKLKELKNDNYILVIFSNQNGVEKGKVSLEFVKKRFENFIKYTELDWLYIASTKKDKYRKPNNCMWKFLSNYITNININKSFYVGDAAGRIKNWKPKMKKDFSCSDRKFAHNIGIKFFTPEEYFLEEEKTDNFIIDGFNPFNYNYNQTITIGLPEEKELVLMVGLPASGKSTIAKTIFKDYVYINMDTLKTKSKCLKLAKESISNNQSVIIDNTNVDKKTRKEYIDIAKKYNYQVRCIVMDVNKEFSLHLNNIRSIVNGVKPVPTIAYNILSKKYQNPDIDEGIDQIKIIKLNINELKSKLGNYFYQYY